MSEKRAPEGPAPFETSFSGPEWQPDAEAGAGGTPPGTPPGPPPPPKFPFGSLPDGSEPPDSGEPPAATPEGGAPAATHAAPPRDEGGEPMGLMDHLSELRSRLVRCCIAVGIGFGVCWAVVDPIFDILIQPLLAVLPPGTHAQYTTLPEAFFTRMYIAFVAGVFLASPAIFYQIWAFVSPGLYEEEKRHILPIAFLSAIFFVAGGAFCYFIVFPFAFSFFVSFSTPDIVVTPKVSDYLSFVLKLLIAFGLIFEMPIFTLFLARMGVLTAAMMRRGRRYAIVGIFILAAILTPPDVVSQLLMACPMLLLYEASIWVAAAFGKKRKTEARPDDDAAKGDAAGSTEEKTAEGAPAREHPEEAPNANPEEKP